MLPLIGMLAGEAGYERGVVFDSGEYLARATALSGVSDTQKFTASFWLISNSDSFYDQNILNLLNTLLTNTSYIHVTAVARLNVQLWGTTGSSVSITGESPFVSGSGAAKHIHFAVDTSDASKKKYYVNGVDASSYLTFTEGMVIDMSMTGVDVCKPGRGGGGYAHMWIAPGQYEPDYTKFIDTDGMPKNLGTDGSVPTGVAPAIYFRGDKNNFFNNLGTGGDFSLTGTLSDSTVDLVAT